MTGKKRYVIRKTYIQTEQHYGDVWFIWDTHKSEQVSPYGTMEFLVNTDIDRRNYEWEKELIETQWKRDSLYFSWENFFYLAKDYRYLDAQFIIRKQKERVRKFHDMRADILEKKNIKKKLDDYNQWVREENNLREKISITTLHEITNMTEFFNAENELDKWLKETRSMYYGGYSDQELFT